MLCFASFNFSPFKFGHILLSRGKKLSLADASDSSLRSEGQVTDVGRQIS